MAEATGINSASTTWPLSSTSRWRAPSRCGGQRSTSRSSIRSSSRRSPNAPGMRACTPWRSSTACRTRQSGRSCGAWPRGSRQARRRSATSPRRTGPARRPHGDGDGRLCLACGAQRRAAASPHPGVPPPGSCGVAVGLPSLEHHGVPPALTVMPSVSFAPGSPSAVMVGGIVACLLRCPARPAPCSPGWPRARRAAPCRGTCRWPASPSARYWHGA